MADQDVSTEESLKEITNSVSLEGDLQVLADEFLNISDYISPKPNTVISNIIGSGDEEIHNLDVSPLNIKILPSAASNQLFNVLGSTYSSQIISTDIENFGTYIFGSILSGFNSGADRYDFSSNTYSYNINSGYNFLNSNQTESSLIIQGGSRNDVLIGNAGNNLIRGNSLGASAPVEASLVFSNPTPTLEDRFGSTLDVAGDTAIVGAYMDDTGAVDAGSAYLYDLSTGTLLFTLNNPTPELNDGFGRIVALNENYAIVGAARDNTNAVSAGSAYVYDVATGNLLYTLNNPAPATSDLFGYHVDIDDDHTVVGAYFNDDGATNAGSIYIYDTATGVLLNTIDNPTPEVNDYFGLRFVLDGDYVVVAARGDNTGATDAGSVYVYNVNTGVLLLTINNPEPEAGDVFGQRLDISGNHLIVSADRDDTDATDAGTVYIYDLTTGTLLTTISNPVPENGDLFGHAVSIDGNYAVVTSILDSTGAANTGTVYIFEVSTGQLVYTLTNPTPEASDTFGQSVSIDGNVLTVGSSRDDIGGTDTGAVYTYVINFNDADTLYGGAGDDTLYGLEGADILYGQDGADILFGGSNSDRFVFESISAFNGIDSIQDFDTLEQDVIDVSNILTGYTFGVDDISDFVRFVSVGGDSTIEIDADGLAGGVGFQAVATIIGGVGLDANTLEASGNLDTVV